MKPSFKRIFIYLLLLLSLLLLSGCGSRSEQKGSGFFRDVNFNMTVEEVIQAEEGRSDSGEPAQYTQYSAILYDEVQWDGYPCDLSYIFDSDEVHLDTILIEVLGGLDFERTKKTLVDLYTDGTPPEESSSEYFSWSSDDLLIVAQNNADQTGIIVLMLPVTSEEVPHD